jgi:division protein CdvB (Snf7/Vps24/ESCRT-III family)
MEKQKEAMEKINKILEEYGMELFIQQNYQAVVRPKTKVEPIVEVKSE